MVNIRHAGMVKHDGKYIMPFRSHLRNGRSIIGLAESGDGVRLAVRPEPFITPAKAEPFAGYEAFGVEDPRICPMEGGYLEVHEKTDACACVRQFVCKPSMLTNRLNIDTPAGKYYKGP